MSKCSRCDEKIEVTGIYTAKSTAPVSHAYATKNNISNRFTGALNKEIHTCNICTSPGSRRKLHDENAFKAYEKQFLNLIIERVDKQKNSVTMNKTNKSDNKQYDTFISTGNKEHSPFIALNIEVDEFGHYTIEDYFTRDRKKEENFFNVWEEQGAKAYIIRVRVGEKFNSTCVKKTGTGKNGICSVTDYLKFNKNMGIVQKYIDDVLNGKKVDKHVYINFADNIGLIKYPYTTFSSTKSILNKSLNDLSNAMSNLKLNETRKKNVNDLSNAISNLKLNEKKNINDLSNTMSNLKLNNLLKETSNNKPCKKKIDCSIKKCKNKTTSITNKCKEHRK
jgi:hypothetical protein